MSFLKGRKVRGINKDVFGQFFKKEAEVVVKTETNTVTEEIKPSYMKQFGLYLKQVANDYKDVARDTAVNCKNYPVKASMYGVTIGSFVALYKTNPDMISYKEIRRLYMNDLILCCSVYNRKTEYYLNSLTRLENSNQLEIKSLVFFSLIMTKDYSSEAQIYEKRCAQLNNPSKFNIFNSVNVVLKFLSRIVDVGVCNRWYFLTKNFENYDIDEREWEEKKPLEI